MPDPVDFPNSAPPSSDDTFFVLRDCRELFQRRLAEIAQQAGILSPAVLAAFTREIGEAHDELASSNLQQDGFGQTAGLTASRITLVGNDDLELEIRINDIANHLKGNERIDHWRAQLRYMTLLRRPKMTMENNPLGFEPINLGLWAICKEGGEKLEQSLARLDRLEEQLQLRLPDVYQELNTLLERLNVVPAQVQIVQPVQRERVGTSATAGGDMGYRLPGGSGGMGGFGGGGGANALSNLQQAMQRQFGGEELFITEPATGQSSGHAGNFTLNASTLVMLNHLMERLRVLELQQMTGLADFTLGDVEIQSNHDSVEQRLPRALKSKDLDLPLGKPAAIALDTLSLIFEAIFATPDLPNAVKVIIGRLQIPLLKLAILDASFFGDTQHPARRLVNGMARAAIGLNQEVGRDHSVCVFLAKIADAVRASLETNEGELSAHLAELDAFIKERDQAMHVLAQPYAQLVQAHEVGEAARTSAQDWLDRTLCTPQFPVHVPAFESFLSAYWRRAMHAAYLDGGLQGARWKECEAIVRELLWSVTPKPDAEERKKLLPLIPALLKRVNGELDRLQVSAEERKAFLNACFDLQTAALRSIAGAPSDAPVTVAPKTVVPVANSASVAEVQILEQGGKLVQYFGQPLATQSPWRTGANPWKEGDWLLFNLPDGERLCGRQCAQSAAFGTVLLFNAEWAFAVALPPAWLEQQVRGGQARVVSESALFDEAAERALATMAQP